MNRVQTINKLIEENKSVNFLQIGLADGTLFKAIKCKSKTGIGSSINKAEVKAEDHFKGNKSKFDFILIDNNHLANELEREIVLSYNRLPDGGILLIHDVIPPSEESTVIPRISDKFCGEVYKVACGLVDKYDLEYSYIEDPVGFLMVKKQGKTRLKKGFTFHDLTFEQFESEWKSKIMSL
jgi:hypothetical protein